MTAAVIIFIVACAVLEYCSHVRTLRDVEGRLNLSSALTEENRQFGINISLKNNGYLPLFYLKICLTLPDNCTVSGTGARVKDNPLGGKYLVLTTWILPGKERKLPVELMISARGRYLFRELILYKGDFLGLDEQRETIDLFHELIVYPQKEDKKPDDTGVGGIIGDLSVRRFILEDPVLISGFREYTGREAMRRISWPQTARAGRIMVREPDHTTESHLTVLLDISGTSDPKILEALYRRCRTICGMLEDKHIRYSFSTNALCYGAEAGWQYVSEGLGSSHFRYILEGLGRGSYIPRMSGKQLAEQVMRHGSFYCGIYYISAAMEPKKQQELAALSRRYGVLLKTDETGGETDADDPVV